MHEEPLLALSTSDGSAIGANVSTPDGTGILPYQTIRELVRAREIISESQISPDQIQPASIDLRLGKHAYRVPASFLPGAKSTVPEKLKEIGSHKFPIEDGAVLEKGCVYIVPLLEQLQLSSKISAFANPKSSTGRLDIFTRVIADRGTTFDAIVPGYSGPLYAEVAPKTFSVHVRTGTRLSQLRFRRGKPSMYAIQLRRLHDEAPLVHSESQKPNFKFDRVGLTVDLVGKTSDRLVGFRAKKHTEVIEVDHRAHYDPVDFWDPVHVRAGRGIVLNPDDFYILATKEGVTVPPDHAAEMIAYDTTVGEFRVHYAGFFDPGFGWGIEGGTRAVLEVRSHEVPFLLEHEQTVGWLRYEKLAGKPDRLYGEAIGSHYARQGLTLGKQFKPWG